MSRSRLRLLLVAATDVLVAGTGLVAASTKVDSEIGGAVAVAPATPVSNLENPNAQLTAAETAGMRIDAPTVSLLAKLKRGVFRISDVIPDAVTAAKLVASCRTQDGSAADRRIVPVYEPFDGSDA
jgi:di/tripeptidase